MSTYISFQGGVGGGGGGGSGGPRPNLGSASGRTGQSNNQDTRTGTTNPGQNSMLLTHRQQLNIDLTRNYTPETGHLTIVSTARIPKRVLLTANCLHTGGSMNNTFSFILDVLLVPMSLHMQTCFNLYLDPFIPQTGYMHVNTRGLRDNVILLRRMTVQGVHAVCAAEQCDIPEEVRNRTDYRLVVTCPVLYRAHTTTTTMFSVLLLLEMEF